VRFRCAGAVTRGRPLRVDKRSLAAAHKLDGSITKGASHGTSQLQLSRQAALEQGQDYGTEDTVQAERDLGHSRAFAARRSASGTRLFNLAIDSKLRACDLVKLKVRDVCQGQTVASRAIVLQQKLKGPFNSRLLSRHGKPLEFGSVRRVFRRRAASSQADSTVQRTCPPGSTPG
jgi:hypothetical protein